MLRLSRLTGDFTLEEKVNRIFSLFSSPVGAYPVISTQFLQSLDFALGPSQEIVIVGDKNDETTVEIIQLLHKKFLPNTVVLFLSKDGEGNRLQKLSSFLNANIAFEHKPIVYICEQLSCKKPIRKVEELKKLIDEL